MIADEYEKLIANIDAALSISREFFLNAQGDTERARWRAMLDKQLDERLRLMRARDAARKVAA